MSEKFDAFSEGINPGGLRNRSEIRLLICYLLKSIDRPLSKTLLNEIMQVHSQANYFEVNQALSHLEETENIVVTKNDNEFTYTITKKGRETADRLDVDLPKTVREKAINAAISLLTLARREQENNVKIEKTDKGCYLNISLTEKKVEMLRVSIYAADNFQAEALKKKFLDNPTNLYETIINSLI